MWESDWLQILGSGRFFSNGRWVEVILRNTCQLDLGVVQVILVFTSPWMLALDHALRGLFSNHKLPSSKF